MGYDSVTSPPMPGWVGASKKQRKHMDESNVHPPIPQNEHKAHTFTITLTF